MNNVGLTFNDSRADIQYMILRHTQSTKNDQKDDMTIICHQENMCFARVKTWLK